MSHLDGGIVAEEFRHATLTLKQLLFAVALVAVAAVILGASQAVIGPNTATAGYLTMLFLLSVVRAHSWKARISSTVWAVAVAVLGFAVGSLGLWVTLAALVAVSLVQGLVTFGESMFLTRSPVNLLAFATLAQGGAEIWQVLLGSAIGAGVIWGFAALAKNRAVLPDSTTALAERVGYGIATALGSVIIVVGSELIGFPHVGWALLSFCIILSVGSDQRLSRSYVRIIGSLIGAVLALLIAMLPAPIPLIAALVCLVLCVAYITAGNYSLFVLFLTPAILLTTASEHSLLILAAFRLEALVVATVVALVCSFAVQWLTRMARAHKLFGHG